MHRVLDNIILIMDFRQEKLDQVSELKREKLEESPNILLKSLDQASILAVSTLLVALRLVSDPQ